MLSEVIEVSKIEIGSQVKLSEVGKIEIGSQVKLSEVIEVSKIEIHRSS